MSRCSWVSDGEQCEFPGTVSESLLGDGRWKCPYHARCDNQAAGAEIVARSRRWATLPNRQEAWIESRKANVYAGESPTVKAIREQIEAHGRAHRREPKPGNFSIPNGPGPIADRILTAWRERRKEPTGESHQREPGEDREEA